MSDTNDIPLAENTPIFNVPRGTALIAYQQVIVSGVSFAYYVILVRILNLSQVGVVSLLAATLAIFNTLSQFALPTAATRFISSSLGSGDPTRAGGVARTSLRLTLGFAIPALLAGTLASPWIGASVLKSSDSATLLIVTLVAAFLLDLTTLYGAYFVGLGLYADLVYQNILFVPISRGLGLILAYRGLGALGIPIGWVVGAFATLLLSLYLWRGKLPRWTQVPSRPLLTFSLPLFASAVIALLQSWGDIAILQAALGQFAATGGYYLVVSSAAFLSILWIPVASALYPALSSSFSRDGRLALGAKLGVAMRLVNLTVLPVGAVLAAISTTALQALYGNSLAQQAVPFAILSITIIFSAQSLLLITALQAIGKTSPILWISLPVTMIDLATVGLGAGTLGTTAGALGRAFLAVATALLAWRMLRGWVDAPGSQGLRKAVILTFCSAGPVFVADRFIGLSLVVAPFPRLAMLLAIFVACFLAASRALSAFSEEDFDLLETALPSKLRMLSNLLSRLIVRTRTFVQ